MSFNPLSLDYIYYPVSAIMWVWYKLFSFLLDLLPGVNSGRDLSQGTFGQTSFYSWALAVVFLVFTLRAILYRPFVRQIETTRQMQELQPQIKALQKKYGKDRQRMALEMQKLQKEHGFNPILGCLPMLAQVPVFLGLFHVLRSFNRTGHNFGELGLDLELNKQLPNYVFSATDVQHFLQANFFGAPLGATMIQSESSWDAFIGFDVSRAAIIAVGVPLMILAGVATHFNSRASVARQSPEAAANPQTAMMNKLALYIFPLGVVVGGPFLPIAIILYWVANNIWTYGQQHYVFGKIEKREEEKKQEEIARRAANAPAPGVKPARKPKAGAKPLADAKPVTDAVPDGESTAVEITDSAADEQPVKTPKPGSRPAASKKAAAKGTAAKGTPAKGAARRGNTRPNRGGRKP